MKTKYKVVMGTLVRCPENWYYRVARNGGHQIVRKENEE